MDEIPEALDGRGLGCRLMQAAPGDILCDEMTYRSAQAAAALESPQRNVRNTHL